MRIKDNYNSMVMADTLDRPVSVQSGIKYRINCEFLHDCAFHCPGCYVYRKNNFDESQLDILNNTVSMFRDAGATFDEIILGPTDFFGALNTEELLDNKRFNSIFENGDVVLTILSTLQSDEDIIRKKIECVNRNMPHPNMEIESLIIFDLQRYYDRGSEYIAELREKIKLLDLFEPAIDYALQINIQDVNKIDKNFSLKRLTDMARKEFESIMEFNPSFMRSRKPHIMGEILQSWNNMLEQQITEENKNDIVVTMANDNHAGFNEITLNYFDGDLYMCPFIYENVFDKGNDFKIPKSDGKYYTWDDVQNFEQDSKLAQFQYALKTSECAGCPHQMSCISKDVLFYMEQYGIKDCIVAKQVLDLY